MVSTSYKKGSFTNVPNHLSALLKKKKYFVINKIIEKRSLVANYLLHKGFPVGKSILEINNAKDHEIFIICTPSEVRLEIINYLIKVGAKNIIIEKPLSVSIKEAEKIKNCVSDNNINCFVNYHRRNVKLILDMKKIIKDCIAINVNYNCGLLNYASHAIDLINFYFGKLMFVKSSINSINLSKELDKSYSFFGELDNKIAVNFNGYDNANYNLLDIDFFCKNKKISIIAGGKIFKTEKKINNLYYQGYSHLKNNNIYKNNKNGFIEFYENLYDFFTQNKKSNFCKVDEALYVVKVCDSVIKSFKNNGKTIPILK